MRVYVSKIFGKVPNRLYNYQIFSKPWTPRIGLHRINNIQCVIFNKKNKEFLVSEDETGSKEYLNKY